MTEGCFKNVHVYADHRKDHGRTAELTFVSIHAPDGRIITFEVTSFNGHPISDVHRGGWSYNKRNKHREYEETSIETRKPIHN